MSAQPLSFSAPPGFALVTLEEADRLRRAARFMEEIAGEPEAMPVPTAQDLVMDLGDLRVRAKAAGEQHLAKAVGDLALLFLGGFSFEAALLLREARRAMRMVESKESAN